MAKDAGINVASSAVSLGGEDFAFYLEKIRGTFIQIGTGETYPNHHPKFQVDPKALSLAADYISQLAIKSLLKIESREE